MRRKWRVLLALLLLLLGLGLLGYGYTQGDASLVQENAAAFCFT